MAEAVTPAPTNGQAPDPAPPSITVFIHPKQGISVASNIENLHQQLSLLTIGQQLVVQRVATAVQQAHAPTLVAPPPGGIQGLKDRIFKR